MRIEFVLAGLGLVAFAWFKRNAAQAREQDAERRGTYRPGSASGDGVKFRDPSQTGRDHERPRDAFTGEDLNPERMIYQCQSCRAWYHGDTLKSLSRDHHGRCVMCGESDLLRDRVTEDRLASSS